MSSPRSLLSPRRIVAAAAAASALATLPSPAPAADRPVGPRLQSILDRAVASPRTTFPGVALHVRLPDGRTWSGAAGRMRLGSSTPMRPDARFRSGSIPKTFVATTILQLVEEGRLRLDAPLTAVLDPADAARLADADRITVRMLLNHTSGLAEYSDAAHEQQILADPSRRWDERELVDRAAAMPRTGAPGERHAYANTNYNLLGLAIEHVTGRPWRAVVRERTLDRVGMPGTSFPAPGTRPRGADIAHGYELVGGRRVDMTGVDSSMVGAAGGNSQLTTTRDLARFNRALLDGRLFRHRATLDAMRSFVATPGEHGQAGYGLGLERYVLGGGIELVGHMGTAAGYRAYMFHLPAQDIDLAMVTTTPDDPMPVLTPALRVLRAAAR